VRSTYAPRRGGPSRFHGREVRSSWPSASSAVSAAVQDFMAAVRQSSVKGQLELPMGGH
jgi:hypothetical protein